VEFCGFGDENNSYGALIRTVSLVRKEDLPIVKPPQPPVGNPQITQPPVGNPQITQSSVANPQFTQPPVANPQFTQPPVANPQFTQPPVANPQFTQPPVVNPLNPPNSVLNGNFDFNNFPFQQRRPFFNQMPVIGNYQFGEPGNFGFVNFPQANIGNIQSFLPGGNGFRPS
jgi:hypothetical protein